VTLLAGAKAARGTASAAWTLAEALCFTDPPARQAEDEAGYWSALLAAQVLIENKSLEHMAERHRPKVERIRQWLRSTLAHGALPPVDRAQAGDSLATIGAPRFRADAWYLPDEPLLGFVEIPSGPFLMGSDQSSDPEVSEDEMPQHTLTLPRYYIGCYPVTVAQFRAFVEASGHRPEDERSLRGLSNHPVVNITWYETIQYCDWLTAQLRTWEGTPEPLARLLRHEGWRLTLPSEAEWEKAARGSDGRLYPWDNDPDLNRANYADTDINATSAMGCFLGGVSPYGVEEMSGNVWEWTRSLWGRDWLQPEFKYPYALDDGREDLEAPREMLRVRRGGAFYGGRRDVRCAVRRWDLPFNRSRRL
jgi:formylglycine-generating enzyme required for sulfatase activity